MPRLPFEADPFTQALVDGEENAYGMSFEDMANEYADTMGGMAEFATPYGDAVALNDWKEGKLDTLGKILTTVGLWPGMPNVKTVNVRNFKSKLLDKGRSELDLLVNPTQADLERASTILAKEARRGNIWDNAIEPSEGAEYAKKWRAVVDGSTGDVYAWPALDAIHNDVIQALVKESNGNPANYVGFMTGDKQWDTLFDPKVSKKGLKTNFATPDQDFMLREFANMPAKSQAAPLADVDEDNFVKQLNEMLSKLK